MDLYDLVIISLQTLRKNMLRSLLTILGVVIGIAAVTTMVSIGQGASQLVRNQFQNLGSNVVGVLEPKGANLVGMDQDDIILMPYTTVRKRLQGSAFSNVGLIIVSARSEELSAQAEKEIRSLLMQRHRISEGEQPDFEIRNT